MFVFLFLFPSLYNHYSDINKCFFVVAFFSAWYMCLQSQMNLIRLTAIARHSIGPYDGWSVWFKLTTQFQIWHMFIANTYVHCKYNLYSWVLLDVFVTFVGGSTFQYAFILNQYCNSDLVYGILKKVINLWLTKLQFSC